MNKLSKKRKKEVAKASVTSLSSQEPINVVIQHQSEKIHSKKLRKHARKRTYNEDEASIADNSTITSAQFLGYNLRNAQHIEIDHNVDIEFDKIKERC